MEKYTFRFAMSALLCLLLLLSTAVLAQTDEPAATAVYVVEQGTASGEDYRMTVLSWQVSCAIGGGGYRLVGPVRPNQPGAGCCCAYAPLLLKTWSEP